jgi:hypothetical protein
MNDFERAIENIKTTAITLPNSVGHHHRATLVEAAKILEKEIADRGKEIMELRSVLSRPS